MLKTFFGQMGEDVFIFRNFINQKVNDGIFIELGACDGLICSNTLFFEKYLNFTGILIEPDKKNYDELVKNRPNCKCFNYAIDSEEGTKEFILNGTMSGLSKTIIHDFDNKDLWCYNPDVKKIKVKCKQLKNIIAETNITHVDFFSLDVEGGELEVLKSIDWGLVDIYLICIELCNEDTSKDELCREFLKNKGFEFIIRIGLNDYWINNQYKLKNRLFKKDIKKPFTKIKKVGDNFINDDGKFIYLKDPIPIEETYNLIRNYEKEK